MTYYFSKIITSITKPQYGNFITNERYMVIDNEDEVGQYFVTQKMDYFSFLNDELEMYSISHVAIEGKKNIVNQLSNKIEGHYEINPKKHEDVNTCAEIILGKKKYNCSRMPMGKDTTHTSIMANNDSEQVFINCIEKKNKIEVDIVEVLHGTIEMQTHNLLLLFTSIYFLEEILFMGNAVQ